MSNTAIFHQNYVGPQGPHLSQLTTYSLFGNAKQPVNHSIHPRVEYGGEKLNTSKPKRKERGVNPFARSMTKFRARGK